MIPSLHDADIIGIEYKRAQKILILKLMLVTDLIATISIDGVFGFELSPFQDQNIIFHFRVYEKKYLNDEITENLGVQPGYMKWMADEFGILVEIDSATGMGGYIVSKEISYNETN